MSRRDRKRQRNLDRKAGALAKRGRERDGAADRLDIFAHHIHADRGRKRSSPPSKSQAQRLKRQISIAHARDFDLLGEAERNRFLSNARNIQTAAIVDDIDRDLAASCEALIRIVPASGLPFASLSTEVLDPMRRAIADHVRQRIADESISWRSSAVSAPSVTRWIFLPTSAATSRTSRGRPPNRRPTGCMRARMTASCRSEVSPERRCRGALNVSSFSLRVSSRS